MQTLCQFLLDLTRRPKEATATQSSFVASLGSEEDAIREMYFSRGAMDIDPALVDRLLWWEGVAAPVRAGGSNASRPGGGLNCPARV